MNHHQQFWCHQLVRATIGEHLGKNIFPSSMELLQQLSQGRIDLSPLKECLGNFVTLKIAGQLRGCIGSIESSVSLWQGLIDHALASAFHDPRFLAVELDEFDLLEYEISILSKVLPLPHFDCIQVGVHGLIAEMAGRRGLLLPQVALEWGWNRQQFIEQVCIKAGLPKNAWQSDGIRFYYFSAEVF